MNVFPSHHLRFYRRTCLPVVLLTGEIAYRIVGATEFPWDAHPMTHFHDQYRARFADGSRALVGMRDETLVFSAWVEQRQLRVDELRWEWTLPSGDAVVFDCVTMPEWRSRGIYPDALRRLSGFLAEEGTRHLWIYVEEENAASRRGIEKADFEYHGSISSRHFFGWTQRRGVVAGVNA